MTIRDLVTGADGHQRCGWCAGDPDYERYHDEEWGVAVRDDRRLFEKLCLEGFQAGLSWLTILRKRAAFREVFHDFDIETVADMDPEDVERLLTDDRIVRHRGKIEAAIGNARHALELAGERGSLAEHLWSFAPGDTDRPAPKRLSDLPAVTPESTALSRDLRRRGWRYVGPTTLYAFMQAMGMVNDHLVGCSARR